MKKISYRIILFFSSFIMLALALSSFIYIKHNQNLGCGLEIPHFVCGTTPVELTDLQKEGKKVFNINCAACHQLSRNLTGPALDDIVSNRDYPSPDYVYYYITNEDSLHSVNDQYAMALNQEYSNSFLHNFKLTREEFEMLMEYIN